MVVMIFAKSNDPESIAVLWEAVRECVDGGRVDLISSVGKFLFNVVKSFTFLVGGESSRVLNEGDKRLRFCDPVDSLVVQSGSVVEVTEFFACRRPRLAWGPRKVKGGSFDVRDDNIGE